MNKNIITKVKESIEKMPPLSPVVHKIIEVANDVTASARELTEVIQMDPVLMSKLIKMVNSAYFGLPEQITSIKQAVVMLGINTLKNVAISSTVVGQMDIKTNTIMDGDEFWKHSFGVGVASKMIAKEIGIDSKVLEEYFVSGLIHDIGKVLINNFFSDELHTILEIRSKTNRSLLEVEKHVLGVNHQEVGIAIGKKWNFNQNYLYAVGKHHDPSLSGQSGIYSVVISLANKIVKHAGYEDENYYITEEIDESIWEEINVNPEIIYNKLGSLSAEVEKAKEFLQ